MKMTILQALRLRRSSQWEPPTPLDHLLTSPLKWLISIVYTYLLFLRGRPFHPPPTPPSHSHSHSSSSTPGEHPPDENDERAPIRVVCLSDTHDQTLSAADIPPGDLLVHAGDLTNDGSRESIQKQIDWLSSLPHRHKVFICGNHDGWLDPNSRAVLESRRRRRQPITNGLLVNGVGGEHEHDDGTMTGLGLDFKGVQYLENSGVTLEFKGGRRLNLWGSGAVPECGDESFAFQYKRHLHPWKGAIPEETDVLITHTPPAFHRDLFSLGCTGLLAEIWRVKPKLHIFGHVHWGSGTEPFYFDECQRAYESLMSRPSLGCGWWTWLFPLGPLLSEFFPPFVLLSKHSRAAWGDALGVIWYGVNSILWKWLMEGPGSNNGGLFVNAAVMHGNTGKLRRSRRGKKGAVVVVEL